MPFSGATEFVTVQPMTNRDPLLVLEQVEKTYANGQRHVAALQGISLTVQRGEFVALMGPSGCGKSTLLHLLGGMDRPTRGRLLFDGTALETLTDAALARFRRRRVGFVFQFFNLLPTLTVLENAALPLLLDGKSEHEAHTQAHTFLERVGMEARAQHFPAELSGGEMQRVAVARAVVSQPELLLADEPTGSLDSANGEQVMRLLADLNQEIAITIVLATHAVEAARYAKRLIRLRDGVLDHEPSHAIVH
ncbi:MAG: ABC transporter ATP-binding protein [Candidatus Binatia bacterium]